jgi:hypothetical protein
VTQEFDTTRARRFRPRQGMVKTAILLRPAGQGSQGSQEKVRIQAPFGEQEMHGPFYVVASEDGSYGAVQAEFEQAHRQVGPNQWERVEPVLAYQTDERCTVVTTVESHEESTVLAEPGDWIVQQPAGEVMVVKPSDFDARYEPEAED